MAVNVVNTHNAHNKTVNQYYGFSGVPIGSGGGLNRQVIVVVYHYSGVIMSPASVSWYSPTIGSTTMGVLTGDYSSAGNVGISIWRILCPNNDTGANIQVNFPAASAAGCGISIYNVDGARNAVTAYNAGWGSNGRSISPVIPAGGAIIAGTQGFSTSGFAVSWTNFTETFESQTSTTTGFATGFDMYANAATPTITATITNGTGTQDSLSSIVLSELPILKVDPANFVQTNQNVGKLHNRLLGVTLRTYALTNKNVILKENKILTANVASYVYTPQNVNLYDNRSLLVDPAAYAYTPQNVDFFRNYILAVDTASYAITGQNVNLLDNRRLSVTPATSYTLTNQNVLLKKNKRLTVSPASFLLTLRGIGVGVNVPLYQFNSIPLVPIFAGPSLDTVVSVPGHEFTFNLINPKVGAGAAVEMPTHEFNIVGGANVYQYEIIESCSGEQVPLSHMQDSRKLEADAYVDLFEILLSDNSARICLKMNKTGYWQGNYYEGTGVKIEGVGTYADEQVSRPKLTIWNPDGVFSALVNSGVLENAKIYRIRLLKEHFDQDIPVFRRQQWRVSRIASLKTPYISLELRDMLDGQNFLTPGRMFIPPDFPSVSLQ